MKTISFEVTDEDFAALEENAALLNFSVEELVTDWAKHFVKSCKTFDKMQGSPLEKLCRVMFNEFEEARGEKLPITFEEIFSSVEKNTEKFISENFHKIKEAENNG